MLRRLLGHGKFSGNSSGPLPDIPSNDPYPFAAAPYNEHLGAIISTALAYSHRVSQAEYRPGLPHASSAPQTSPLDRAVPAMPRSFRARGR